MRENIDGILLFSGPAAPIPAALPETGRTLEQIRLGKKETVIASDAVSGQSPYLQGLGKLTQRPVYTFPPGRLVLALSTVIWTTALTAFAAGDI